MRKLLFIAAGVAVVLLAIGAAIVLFVDVDQFREPIRAQLEARLKRSVSIGKLGLKLMPLSIRVDDITIGESPNFSSQHPFVTAKETYVGVGIGALLRKQVDVESLHLVAPTVELIKSSSGQWNYQSLGESTSGPATTRGSNIQLAQLQIDDGRIAVTDLQQHKPRAVYDHIDIALKNFKTGRRFDLEAQVHLPAAGKNLIRAHVSGDTPSAGQSPDLGTLDGEVDLNEVSFTGLQAFLGSAPSEVAKAVFNGKAQFQSRGGTLTGKGSIDIAEPRLKESAKLDFQIRDDANAGMFTLSPATLKVGGLIATGNASIRTKETPSTVSAEVRTDNAALADLLNLAAAFGLAEGVRGTGRVSLEAHVSGPVTAVAYNATGSLSDAKLTLDSLSKPVEIQSAALKLSKDQAALDNLSAAVGSSHLRGNIAVHNFASPDLQFNADIDRLDTAELQQMVVPSTGKKSGTFSQKTLHGSGTISVGTLTYNQLALTNVHATCNIENGVVRLDPLTAKLFGGDQAGSITVDTRQAETAFDVRAKINKVDANKLISATTSVKDLLYGMLSGDIDVRANPHKGEETGRALNGTVQLQLLNGKLAGVQMMNELAGLAKFLGYARRSDNFTNIIKLAGTLKIQNGVANTDDLQMQFDGGSLGAAGTIGLVDQQLKLRVTAILAKQISQLAGGSQVGGWMSTALGNSKGELVIPAFVSGTFQKPHFEPDAQRLAKMKLEGLLPTHDNPTGAVSAILGALTHRDSGNTGAKAGQPPAPGAGNTPKKPDIFDIIDSVRKKTEQK
jgi:AsmA protein